MPAGKHLVAGTEEFAALEKRGVEIANKSAFVLVAGGLGERLGYNGIKVALPVEVSTERCFLHLYCEAILALQKASKSEHPIPLAIMTSGDTHARTEALLAENGQFGMAPGQVVLVKQELVPALTDNDAHIAVDKETLLMETKPHGHGDVHMLLHMHGLAQKWADQGLLYVTFFQDTNPLMFHTLPAR